MLLINARAGVSKIHGIGLIAQEYISAGTHAWVFRAGFDVVLSAAQLAELSEPARLQWYTHLPHSGGVYVMRHLRFATLGAVYAVASVLLLTLVGVLFLGESLKWQEAVGIGMAVGSILLLARFV